MPRLSICIPLFNRQELVKETLDSVLAQTFTDWECIIVDDRSTDDSFAVAKSYAERDARFKALQRPEERIKGAPTCRNIAFDNSTGEYVYFFDSDDLMSPSLFGEIIKAMDANPEAEYGNVPWDKFSESSNSPPIIVAPEINDSLLDKVVASRGSFGSPGFIWRRSLLDRSELKWREGIPKGQDIDFSSRVISLAKTEGISLKIPPAVHVRVHDAQVRNSFTKENASWLMSCHLNIWNLLEHHPLFDTRRQCLCLHALAWYLTRHALAYGSWPDVLRGSRFIRKHSKGLPCRIRCSFLISFAIVFFPLFFLVSKFIGKFRKTRFVLWVIKTFFN